jgi:cell division protein FtsX
MTLPKLRYFLREALQNLWQFKTRHIFSLTIICLSFVSVGVVLSLSGNLRFKARELSKNLTVVFYLEKDTPPADRDAVEAAVRSSPLIATVRVVGTDQAMDRFRANFPDLRDILQNLGTNPFPASIEAGLKDAAAPAERVLGFMAEVRKLPGVEDVLDAGNGPRRSAPSAASSRRWGSSWAGSWSWPRSSSSRTSSSSTSSPAGPRSRSSASWARPTPSSACLFSSKG